MNKANGLKERRKVSAIDEQCDELIRLGIITGEESIEIKANLFHENAAIKNHEKPKSRKTAAALGILLGCVCAQKVYLKQIPSAYIMALAMAGVIAILMQVSLFSFSTSFSYSFGASMVVFFLMTMLSIPWLVIKLVLIFSTVLGIIEGVIYLTMPEERFQQTYVSGTRKWF